MRFEHIHELVDVGRRAIQRFAELSICVRLPSCGKQLLKRRRQLQLLRVSQSFVSVSLDEDLG